jgi:hypothetical protein
VFACLAAQPSGAAAASQPPRHVSFPASGPTFSFELRDRAGFQLAVEADEEGFASLSVSRSGQSNTYFTKATVSRQGGIAADFARFGRVSVDFKPLGRPLREAPFPGCHGGPTVTVPGLFVGAIRFHGEGGFARFGAGRVHGEERTTPRWVCRGGGGSNGGQQEEGKDTLLNASTPDGGLDFAAIGAPAFPGALFFAVSHRSYGRVSESRTAIATSKSPASFQFDEGLTEATVRPGGLFQGTASFQTGSAAAPATWSGSLRVSFLGGDTALTGGRIEATLTHPGSSGSGSSTGTFFSGRRPRVGGRPLPLP